MKRFQLTALAAASFAVAAPAMAQSSTTNVTLYGVIDAGVAYVNNVASGLNAKGAHNFQAVSGIGQGNRWGLKGSEDLGGGLKAVFVLENGFNLMNGTMLQNSRMFGRQAYVGLQSAQAGTVTIGRQYDSVVDFVSPLTSAKQWATQYGAHIGDIDNLYNSFRVNNSVKYTSANYSGFSFGALYGFSNEPNTGNGTGFSHNNAFSLGASYANGPLTAALGYMHLSSPGTANGSGAVSNDYSSATDIFYTSAVDKHDIAAAGVSYQIQAATIGFVYSYAKVKYVNQSSIRVNTFELNGKYQIAPNLVGGLAFIYSDGSVGGATALSGISKGTKPRWFQVNAGTTYAFSKRTETYLNGVYQRATGDAVVAAIDNVGGPTGTGAQSQIAVIAGVRHKF
ncbi:MULTISPECIES: porin [Pandoraea]|uniref:porin n=1 Tax=Pandoraea TaxID=93217 RepID=UPI001F5C2514|nr:MULTISPECIES: porin [Pandoraea]MCI3206527.1 porin [Pandoraea sp. LA3]MDN4584555.1 porin [Pandoraea capi]